MALRVKSSMRPAPDGPSLSATPALLEELQDVLRRPKFAKRLAETGVTLPDLLDGGVWERARCRLACPTKRSNLMRT
jgi:hypothetical protein